MFFLNKRSNFGTKPHELSYRSNIIKKKNLLSFRKNIFILFYFYLLFYLNPSLVQSCYKEYIQGYFGVPIYFINDGRACEHPKYTNEYYSQKLFNHLCLNTF